MKHIVLIGLGSIGRRHLRNLASRHPDARFTVVRRQPVQDVAFDGLDLRVTDDLSVALAGPVDLAVLATPSARHVDVLPQLLERGCGLLVEKPIVASLEDCDAVLDLLQKAPPAVRASGFNFRYLPSLGRIKAEIDAGHLGRIVRAAFVAGQWLPDWRPSLDYREVYSAHADQGGGVELDLVHEIDVARWLLGELDLRFALGGRHSSLGLQSNDVSAMVLSGVGGAPPLVQISLDYVSRQRLRHYEIVGDRGGLLWDLRGSLDWIGPDSRRTLVDAPDAFDVGATYLDMIDHIGDALRGNWRAPLQPLEDGLLSTRLAIQARDRGSER